MNCLCFFLAAGALTLSGTYAPAQTAKKAPAGKDTRQILKALETQCLKARTAESLDALWTELAACKSLPGGQLTGENFLVRQELEAAIYFVGQWREYLTAHGLGNKTSAYNILAQLLEDRRWVGLVRRSEVLNRYQERYKFFQIRYSTESIEDLPEVIASLEKLERLTDNPGSKKETLDEFIALRDLWESRKNSQWDRIEKMCRLGENDHIDICRFKLLILAHAVAGYLNLDAKYHKAPEKRTTAPEHLKSLIAQAIKNKDLVTLWRTTNYLNFLTPAREPAIREEIKALDFCLTGQKQEADGQWEQAVLSYRSALHCLAGRVPLAVAAERLADLQKSYPEAYQAGTQKSFLTGQKDSRPGLPWEENDPRFNPRLSSEAEQKQPWKKY